jgi:hypothetical protein
MTAFDPDVESDRSFFTRDLARTELNHEAPLAVAWAITETARVRNIHFFQNS